jgi:hypothetical protein
MVRHHAPPLRRLVVDVGGNHITPCGVRPRSTPQCVRSTLCTTAGHRLDLAANLLGPGPDAAIGEQGVKRGADRAHANQARTARDARMKFRPRLPSRPSVFRCHRTEGPRRNAASSVVRRSADRYRLFLCFGHGDSACVVENLDFAAIYGKQHARCFLAGLP